MTKLSTIPQTNAVTPLLSKSLGSQDLMKHRAAVAFELEVLAKHVDRFGWDRDRGTPAQDRMMVDWMNALHDYPLAEVQAACVASVIAYPNKMPNYGHVKAQINAARQKAVRAQPKPDPVVVVDDTPMTPEQRVEHEANLSRFIGRREMPRAQSEATTRANINAAKAQLKAAGVAQ